MILSETMILKEGDMTDKKQKRTRLKPTDRHYVNNKEFLQDMIEYRKMCDAAKEKGEPRPRLTDAIGKKILLIAQRTAFKHNFINYSFRDEMIADAIENCVMYAHNFNPEKSSNPFSYFTTMVSFAFIRRIQKEKKEFLKKVKYVRMSGPDDGEFNTQSQDDSGSFENNYRNFLRSFYDVELPEEEEKERKKRETVVSSIDITEVLNDKE